MPSSVELPRRLFQMLQLAAAADNESPLPVPATPGASQSPLVLAGNVPTSGRPKKKPSANAVRIRQQAWRADKVVRLCIDRSIITDVDDLKGLENGIVM